MAIMLHNSSAFHRSILGNKQHNMHIQVLLRCQLDIVSTSKYITATGNNCTTLGVNPKQVAVEQKHKRTGRYSR